MEKEPKTVEERLIAKGVDAEFLKAALQNTEELTKLLTEIKEKNDANLEEQKKILDIIQKETVRSTNENKEKAIGYFTYTNLTVDEISALAGVSAALDQAEFLINQAKSHPYARREQEKYNTYDDPYYYSKNSQYEPYWNDYPGFEDEYTTSYDDRYSR